MISRVIVNVIHYLDDFLIWSEDASRCARDLQLALSICSQLGLSAEPSKVEGPDTTITFLGIEIDSIKEELRLPQSKLVALKQLLASWSSKRVATKRELLLGHLNHSATVVPAGKSFLRHLINAMSQLRQQSHLTRLNTLCRSDIIWWLSFVEKWNGFFHAYHLALPSFLMHQGVGDVEPFATRPMLFGSRLNGHPLGQG